MDELSMGLVQITACFALQCQDSSVLYLLLLFFWGGSIQRILQYQFTFFFNLTKGEREQSKS